MRTTKEKRSKMSHGQGVLTKARKKLDANRRAFLLPPTHVRLPVTEKTTHQFRSFFWMKSSSIQYEDDLTHNEFQFWHCDVSSDIQK
jgi:hypothetical protein